MQLQTSIVKIGILTINIQKGNITDQEDLDALVLPTNPLLLREPGISAEIFKKCGSDNLEKALKKIKENEKQKRNQKNDQIGDKGIQNKQKEKQPLILDFTEFLAMQQQEEQEQNQEEIRFPFGYVDCLKSYNLKDGQKIQNLLFVVEPESFNEQLIIQSIKNIILKSNELGFKKVAIPILCIIDKNFEPKVWAFQYKKSFYDVQQQLKPNTELEIVIVCFNDDVLYGFQKTFQSSEFVKTTNQYITDVQNVEVIINPVNQNNPHFGASGDIIQKAGSALEQDIKTQVKKGKRWVLSKSFRLEENNIKYVLTYIGPIDKRMSRAEKLQYFFQKILQICNDQLQVESICIPLLAIPQAIFYQNETQNFVLNRIAISLKDAILEFEKQNKKHKYIMISIQNDQMREFCIQLFS
ncbi:unnamed protein product [Paramecium sonneborni]|uniref:Macro domain-containing protein n=1 Tax=Paramecium sonneborni TaxID=65129 RepID=A0A8S1K3L4_9CILI|nr:unnamed protein product [Paramecium sonneborni]